MAITKNDLLLEVELIGLICTDNNLTCQEKLEKIQDVVKRNLQAEE